jgi:hypothetical protein
VKLRVISWRDEDGVAGAGPRPVTVNDRTGDQGESTDPVATPTS